MIAMKLTSSGRGRGRAGILLGIHGGDQGGQREAESGRDLHADGVCATDDRKETQDSN